MTLVPFPWRRLTPEARVEHRLDASGRLLLRGAPDGVPFTTARVRDGKGGFALRSLADLGFRWAPVDDGWELRSASAVRMERVAHLWSELVEEACQPLDLDRRAVLVTIACEAPGATPDSDGLVKAPRTEPGYPRRHGEGDPGDFDRDAEDWQAYATTGRGTTRSSHGLMQTLISTAVAVRPDLFAGVEPRFYRSVLWSPASSIACGAGYLAHFPRETLADPLALRVRYASGSIRPSSESRWGAVLYDELVPLAFVAHWNDEASLRSSASAPMDPPSTALVMRPATGAWLFAAFSLFALSAASACVAVRAKHTEASS